MCRVVLQMTKSIACRIAKKVSHYLGDVLEEDRDKLHDNLLANGCKMLHNSNYLT